MSSKGITRAIIEPWKNKVLELVQAKIDDIRNNFTDRPIKSVLKDDHEAKLCLKELHNNFVFCPTDKAANNVSIICKQFYAKTLIEELSSNTYTQVLDTNEKDIVKNHLDFQNSFLLPIDSSMDHLPPIYWIPKMHKNPIKARFIIGSKTASLKPLGKAMTNIFSLAFKMKNSYYRKSRFFSGLKHFWPIDSHNQIIETLDRLSKKKQAHSINTFDFSTLYTKIPHDKLLDVLSIITDSLFDNINRKHIVVGNKSAYYVKDRSFRFKFEPESIKCCTKFLMDNAYFKVGNAIFRQIIGIPMGSDPAPFFANLFLSHYEASWIKSLKSTDYERAKKLLNAFRFIDDLASINDQGEFERSHQLIYPQELVLNKENESSLAATFLDLDIKVVDNSFVYQLYDKRDDYNFDIVRFPFLSSNMPSRMFYSTISAEILRICRASSEYGLFLGKCKIFLKRMKSQGARKERVLSTIKRFLHKHRLEFEKFGQSIEAFIDSIKYVC